MASKLNGDKCKIWYNNWMERQLKGQVSNYDIEGNNYAAGTLLREELELKRQVYGGVKN